MKGILMAWDYVEQREGGYYLAGTRISLDSIVYLFRDGASPETIVQEFPSLSLEEVYGAITFYLANRAAIDTYIQQGEEEFDRLVPPLSQSRPELYAKLERARQELASKRS